MLINKYDDDDEGHFAARRGWKYVEGAEKNEKSYF